MTHASGHAVRRVDDMLPNAESIAASSRRAATALLRRRADPWAAAELVGWWSDCYRRVAHGATAIPMLSPSDEALVEAGDVDALVARACRGARLGLCGTPASRILDEAVVRGLASIAIDAAGTAVWLPFDVPGAGLSARLLSLLAVDYAVCASDYSSPLEWCAECALPRLGGSCDCPRH